MSFAGRSPVAPVYEVRANRPVPSVLVVGAGIKTARWKRFWKRRPSKRRVRPPLRIFVTRFDAIRTSEFRVGRFDAGTFVAAVAVARCFGATTIERNPKLVAHWIARWRKLPARSVYNEVRSWLGKADNRPDLANIDVPALILHGEEDSIFPMSIAEELEAGIPNARLVSIPLAGHTANLEQPEVCNEAIRGFLGSVFGGT